MAATVNALVAETAVTVNSASFRLLIFANLALLDAELNSVKV